MNTPSNSHFIVLIPAYNPDYSFIDLVENIIKQLSPKDVIIVNDGSASSNIFDQLLAIEKVHVISHKYNRGKGAALKTGFQNIICNHNEIDNLVTIDADGQHSISDISNVLKCLSTKKQKIVIGARKFDSRTPSKSKIGNYLTRFLFCLFTGVYLKDTQTGLRGLSADTLAHLIELKGNHFEFELEVLLWCVANKIEIKEVPIDAIYFNRNENTNFKPITDSLRIYKVLLSFLSKKVFFLIKPKITSRTKVK